MLRSIFGLLLVITVFVVSWLFFTVFYVWPILLVFALKHLLGNRVIKPVFTFFSSVINFVKWGWFMWFTFLFEAMLGIVFSYTIVRNSADTHASPHAMTRSHGDKCDKPCLDLSRVFLPPSKPGKVNIIFLNHHSRVDWVYFAIFLIRSRAFWTLRFVLKKDIKHIPVLGWAMETFGFIFLTRSWESDKVYIQDMLNYQKRMNESCTLVIFPEGTDLSRSNIEKSQSFAREKGLPIFYHVLNPRTTGLTGMKNIIGAENIEKVFDCTIGYTYGTTHQRPNEASLINGSHSRKVHLLVRSYSFHSAEGEAHMRGDDGAAIPTGDKDFHQWIHNRFAEKEQLLSRFYRNKPVGYDTADVREVYGPHCVIEEYDCDKNYNDLDRRQPLFAISLHRIRECICKIWWQRLCMVMLYFFTMVCLFWCIRWWRLLLFCTIATAIYATFLTKVKDLQQALFLRHVSDDQSIVARLGGKKRKSSSPKTQVAPYPAAVSFLC